MPARFALVRAVVCADMTLSKNRSRLEDLATQAWIFGYPLLIAAVSRDVMTAVPSPVAMKAPPLNQFAYARTTPDATFTDVVSPNADTLYSSGGWLDVSTEPQVLALPDFGTRYWLVPILDAWSDVFTVPGSRTVGRTGGGPYLVAGPNWKGNVPKGLTLLRSPTAMNWIVARYATSGGEQTWQKCTACRTGRDSLLCRSGRVTRRTTRLVKCR